MLRNNSDMPKTLKNKMVSGNPRPYSTGDYSMWHITLCLKLVMWSGVGLDVEQRPSTRTHNPQPHTRTHDQL